MGQIFGERVADRGQGGGGKRDGARGDRARGWGKGEQWGAIYILMKFSTKQIEH